MTRATTTFYFDTMPSPIGDLLLATDADGLLRALDFEEYQDRMRWMRQNALEFETAR